MAILYGTQSNGETLPVQVNSFGQLVAQGLDGAKGEKGDKGDKGDQGEQGEQGPPGPIQTLTETLWTPELDFESDGAAMLDVNSAIGVVWDGLGLSVVTFTLILNDIGLTNIRGWPVVKGFPVLKTGNAYNPYRSSGWVSEHTFFQYKPGITIRNTAAGDTFRFYCHTGDVFTSLNTVDINADSTEAIRLSATFIGIRANSEEIEFQKKVAAQEALNS